MKRYLILKQNEFDKYYHYIAPFESSIYIRTIDNDPLSLSQIKEIINYESFSFCIRYNWLKELWDLPYSYAVDLIFKNQVKYLRTPLYMVYDSRELIHLETGIEEFWSRFEVKEEDKQLWKKK